MKTKRVSGKFSGMGTCTGKGQFGLGHDQTNSLQKSTCKY